VAYRQRDELKAKVPSIVGDYKAHHEAQMKVFVKDKELEAIYPADINLNPF
jgi:hypothetical protein